MNGQHDPWDALERDVEATIKDLHERKNRFAAMCVDAIGGGSSPALKGKISVSRDADAAAMYTEMQSTIQGVEWDCEDLAAAVSSALDHPEKYSLPTAELIRRQDFVQEMERRVARVRDDVERLETDRRRKVSTKAVDSKGRPIEYSEAAVAQTSDNMRSAMELQTQLKEEEDQLIDRLTSGVRGIKAKAETIGSELKDQERMLDDLDKDVSMLQLKLEGAMKRVGKLIDNSSDSKKMGCIAALLIILVIMIFVLFSD